MRSSKQIFRHKYGKLRNYNNRLYCNLLPSSEVVIIKKKKRENEDANLKTEKKKEENMISNNSKEFRVNEVNIQMISKNIYEQLFKTPSQSVDPDVIKSCQNNLLKHGIDYQKCSHLPDVELKLPKLEGNDIVEHFYNIGEKQSAPYRELLQRLATSELPPMPKLQAGLDIQVNLRSKFLVHLMMHWFSMWKSSCLPARGPPWPVLCPLMLGMAG